MSCSDFRSSPAPRTLALAAVLVAAACTDVTTEGESQAPVGAALASWQAPFATLHQGFEHGAAGWYDGGDPGPLGWCGQIDVVETERRSRAAVPPS